jgi:N-methylhydantoinase A/oxoprolinase/acetone carboxylase beta subunit
LIIFFGKHNLGDLEQEAKMIVGIDTGGTFTDVVVLHNGKLHQFKLPSTPNDPATVYADVLKNISAMFQDKEPE